MTLKQKQAAFAAEYSEIFDFLYRYVCYRIENRAEAEDVVSQAVLKGYEKLWVFDPENGSLRQWMCGVAKNQVLQYWRGRKVTVDIESVGATAMPRPWIGSVEHVLEKIDSESLVEKLISELPQEVKTLLAMRYEDEMTYDEIAEATGKSGPAVRKWFSRLHKRLYEKSV